MATNEAQSSAGMVIKVSRNGPYLVKGNVPLLDLVIVTNEKGESYKWSVRKKYPSSEGYSLCRCGLSRGKPFCDGTHAKVNFDGAETASDKPYIEQSVEYVGPDLKLNDAEVFCASARFCHRAEGIWELIKKAGDPEAKAIAIEEGCDCPSGTLVISDRQEGKVWEPEFTPCIALIDDPQKGTLGPIWLRGGIHFESASGKRYEIRNRVTLCRCGKSTNKPFCDSSHYPE